MAVIKSSERRKADALRRQAIAGANDAARRLASLRAKELHRVTRLLEDVEDTALWGSLVDNYINEAYLPQWWRGVMLKAGIPQVVDTYRTILNDPRATLELPPFEAQLADFAERRAGNNIVLVTGTFKDGIKEVIRTTLDADPNTGVELLAKRIEEQVGILQRWQCRRIAQTEALIGAAEAQEEASRATGMDVARIWCISGLGNTRDSHAAMDGKAAEGDEPFVLPDGTLMMYPHDLSFNPPAEEIINCACSCLRKVL